MTARARVGVRRAGGWLLASLAFLLLLLLPLEAGAQRVVDRPGAAEAERAIAELRSPYCPGFMLEVCPSPDAAALRDSLYDLAAEGATSAQLVEWMVGNHGEEWRGVPRRSGAGLWAWLIPPLAILVAVGAVFGWLRTNRAETVQVAEEETISAHDRERLAAALREWEESGEEVV